LDCESVNAASRTVFDTVSIIKILRLIGYDL
jgi:hypothetical protein